jgi:hypothetical protein
MGHWWNDNWQGKIEVQWSLAEWRRKEGRGGGGSDDDGVVGKATFQKLLWEKQFHECGCLSTLSPYHLIYMHFWTGNIRTVWLADSASFCSGRVTNCLHLTACVSVFSILQFFLICLIIFHCV